MTGFRTIPISIVRLHMQWSQARGGAGSIDQGNGAWHRRTKSGVRRRPDINYWQTVLD